MEHRTLGSTGKQVSVLAFGGVLVTNATTEDAARHVAEAYDRGVTYFDVAPRYGNAQEMLGPALRPYRDSCFLACKSLKRTANDLEADLNRSLGLLRVRWTGSHVSMERVEFPCPRSLRRDTTRGHPRSDQGDCRRP